MKRILRNRLNILLVTILILALLAMIPRNYEFVINHSESLLLKVVLIKKDVLPKKIGQIFVFKVKNNPAYKNQEVKFIKLVGGIPGDEIKVSGGEVYINKIEVLGSKNNTESFYNFNLAKITHPEEIEKRKISINDRKVYVAGELIGIAKPFTNKFENFAKKYPNAGKFDDGEYKLHVISSGVIPPHKFFAHGTHIDSYDSRYQEIGLIDEKDIIGTAVFAW